eukprot:7753364-Pyramimonas_sp.AAC.1
MLLLLALVVHFLSGKADHQHLHGRAHLDVLSLIPLASSLGSALGLGKDTAADGAPRWSNAAIQWYGRQFYEHGHRCRTRAATRGNSTFSFLRDCCPVVACVIAGTW